MRILIVLAVLVLGMQDAPRKRGFLGASVTPSGSALKVDRIVPRRPASRSTT
jgi:hypothetical protein